MNAQNNNAAHAAARTAIDEILSALPPESPAEARELAKQLFAGIRCDEMGQRPPSEWSALVGGLLDFIQKRKPGETLVRVFDPVLDENGWEITPTVLQINMEDMPFLVDSVSIAIRSQELNVYRLLHPVMQITRDPQGTLQKMGDGHLEAVMHIELDRLADKVEFNQLLQNVRKVLDDARAAVSEWPAMHDRMLELADDLGQGKLGISAEAGRETEAFLRWVAKNHFTYLGYREYEVERHSKDDEVLRAKLETGLGILRGKPFFPTRSLKSLTAITLPRSGAIDAVILTKTNARATVHRGVYMDYIGVLGLDEQGRAVHEYRFLGLFTSGALATRPQDLPLIRRRMHSVMERSGLRVDSHSGKSLRHILETLPRDELFQASESELVAVCTGVLELAERARVRLFLRTDRYLRFYTCLIYVPRDRFNTELRLRIENLIRKTLGGERLDSQVLLDESPLARLYLAVRPLSGVNVLGNVDATELEARVADLARDWRDDLSELLSTRHGEVDGLRLANRFVRTMPNPYIEAVTPAAAADDVEHLAKLHSPDELALQLFRAPNGSLHFKIIRLGEPVGLSDILPMLEHLGLKVQAERLYQFSAERHNVTVQDFEVDITELVRFPLEQVATRFTEAFEAVWRGEAESDGFNQMVLAAQLDWRQVAMIRTYCKYLQQVGVPFSQAYMEAALYRYPAIVGMLVELFLAKFDPDREALDQNGYERFIAQNAPLLPEGVQGIDADFVAQLAATLSKPRKQQVRALTKAVRKLLDSVDSVDDDRILRLFLGCMGASLRTNYFCDRQPEQIDCIAIKFDSTKVPELPKPKPFREIFVYSPRVEGIHLRFGPVARGGLRWSDRPEDFRTEVLGLAKAQMVKNTVIVPVGSKGGFYVKLPPQNSDREAQINEGIACYRMFIHALLDLTDNLVEGVVAPPDRVVRHDEDDTYLVVAADKGTATFSDIANSISTQRGYWLGDAFASGGSHGYDHKVMAITAKGAWESVKRHFRTLNRDCQKENFTVAGVGDLSGDVFGNGMLLSKHIRLLAAFDHRHFFLDPNPDVEVSWQERKRVFQLTRSTWESYDPTLISKGGGVWPRSVKSIPISVEVRAALGIEESVDHLAPAKLIQAILKAPVDMFWNGGIGTYVKASSESHAEVGDRANNMVRVNGNELRCKVVGEGGNLGLTQRGRIEAGLNGVLLNTDFIDNSAGVDTSDHEVNIKILLDDAVHSGLLSEDERNTQLAALTDEVERLVLWDDYRQNQAISLMEHMAIRRMGSFVHLIRTMEAEGLLDRQIEFLPSDAELAERRTRKLGLTRPEFAILLSYDKIRICQQLLNSDVPEDPYLSKELQRYFPEPLREPFAKQMLQHSLRREIIVTAVTNTIVNRMGASFVQRMHEDTGQDPAAVAKAFTIAREILHARRLWSKIEAHDGKVSDAVQIEAVTAVWELIRAWTRWLLNRQDIQLDIAANVERYAAGVDELRSLLPGVLTEVGHSTQTSAADHWHQRGLDTQLSTSLSTLPALRQALDVVEVAHACKQSREQVARVFYELGGMLELDWLRDRIEELPVENSWHAQARGSLRDELAQQHRLLTVHVLESGVTPGKWLARDDPSLRYTLGMLGEIRGLPLDYPIASVALRRLAQLVRTG